MTVTEVINYLRRMHNELNAQTPFWSDAELYALMEAKANEVCSYIGLIESKDTSLTSTSGTADYDYPTNVIRIRRVWYDGIPLKYLNRRQFEARMPQGTAPSGTPREYGLFNNVITLIPTPSVSSDTITLFCEKKQSAITTSSSTLDIPAVFHPALCDAILSEMWAKDLNSGMATMYQNKWLSFHIPAMKQFAKRRRRIGSPSTVIDADSVLETEFGVI